MQTSLQGRFASLWRLLTWLLSQCSGQVPLRNNAGDTAEAWRPESLPTNQDLLLELNKPHQKKKHTCGFGTIRAPISALEMNTNRLTSICWGHTGMMILRSRQCRLGRGPKWYRAITWEIDGHQQTAGYTWSTAYSAGDVMVLRFHAQHHAKKRSWEALHPGFMLAFHKKKEVKLYHVPRAAFHGLLPHRRPANNKQQSWRSKATQLRNSLDCVFFDTANMLT